MIGEDNPCADGWNPKILLYSGGYLAEEDLKFLSKSKEIILRTFHYEAAHRREQGLRKSKSGHRIGDCRHHVK